MTHHEGRAGGTGVIAILFDFSLGPARMLLESRGRGETEIHRDASKKEE